MQSFKGMFHRLVRAIGFLAAQPEWGGQVVAVVGHSQDGNRTRKPEAVKHPGLERDHCIRIPIRRSADDFLPDIFCHTVRQFDVVHSDALTFSHRLSQAGIHQ